MRTFAITAALLGALASSANLSAQQTTTLAIHVVDTSDVPVAGARLEVVGTRFAGVSDNAGWVRLQGVPAGPTLLRVSRIGYDPLQTTVQLAGGAAFEADVELARAPVAVTPVTARSTPRNRALDATGFYRRRETGFGAFLTEEDIARSGAQRTSDVFRRIAGVRVIYDSNPRHRGYKLQSARYGLSLSQGAPQSPGAFTPPAAIGGESGNSGANAMGGARVCQMVTLLDGVQVQLDDIDQVQLENLGAVEVYRGPAEIPAEFNATGAVCGVVALWTRTAAPGQTYPSSTPAAPAPAPNPAP
jgi:carboxypeptidase family protein